MLPMGYLVDRKYKILSEIGHGGMSVVYLAINETANKTWAIKEVRKDGVVEFEAVRQRLMVETEMLKRLRHPHLPSIVDVINTRDSFLIVMDYIEGGSLEKYLRQNGAAPKEQVLEWGRQLCDVLGYLHRQTPPIIYRDMKPANIMLKPDGDIALIDFGIAREFKNRTMVEDTTCLGTRGYAAPEQFGGRGQTDARTDIYCLGATLYHLLTGHSPAEPPYEIKPLRYWTPLYSGTGVEKLIAKCCQQDPANRYQSCTELMYALHHVNDEDDAARRSRKRRWMAFVASLAVGLVGTVGAVAFGAARRGVQQASYQYQIMQGKSSASLSEAARFYLSAIRVDPGSELAYQALMESVIDECNREGSFTPEIQSLLKTCLQATPGGSTLYRSRLKMENREAYDQLMYQVGLMYFFMADNSRGSRGVEAKNYLAEVVSAADSVEDGKDTGTTLEGAQLGLANRLYTISTYINSLGNRTNQYGVSPNSYRKLWDDMNEMIDGDLRNAVGRDIYAIKIYELAANWICERGVNFKNDGVTEAEMRAVLQQIDEGLRSLPRVSQDDSAALASAKDTLTNAKNSLDSVYQQAAE